MQFQVQFLADLCIKKSHILVPHIAYRFNECLNIFSSPSTIVHGENPTLKLLVALMLLHHVATLKTNKVLTAPQSHSVYTFNRKHPTDS